MTERRAYPSDLSDARWSLIAPRLTAWRQARTDARTSIGVKGRTPTHDLREIFNAILYVNRTGIAWRYLPHDFPPHATVYGYFALWSKEGIFTELNYQLTGLVRDHHGRNIEPTASIMDTQSVKTSTNVPLETQGIDAGKKTSDAQTLSSSELESGLRGRRKSGGFVVVDALSEAVVQAADQAVEEIALGGGVPVAGFTSAIVMGSGAV